MKRIEDLNYYELLEVSPSASAQEIHKAYERIRRVYEPNSIALYSLFSAEESAAIHQRIEEAYRTLVYEDNRKRYDAQLRGSPAFPEQTRPSPLAPAGQRRPSPPATDRTDRTLAPRGGGAPQPAPAGPQPSREDASAVSRFITEFTGPAIKALREQLGHELRAIADQTKVGIRYLEYMEEENYGKLPARPYLRGFLMLYAKALGCDPERMAGDYLKRYEAAMKLKAK
jgi:curved DNA-binding protein CbpA